ncbi:hypothetical protein Vadar_012955 [Vaccinium darrowii]|uniref:Uncharacterized protein n=1 Tax=Vaccinium darrowii TaxID=229202 RepID=A0ACB7Z3D5_9ERIC|nr:hypothetical protein Vadar_012955 [Vaccinium darrowii]
MTTTIRYPLSLADDGDPPPVVGALTNRGRDEAASLLEPCSIISEGTVGAQLLSNLGVRLSDLQIRELEAPFSEAEIRDAVFQMKGMKAPGPDGFVAGFY